MKYTVYLLEVEMDIHNKLLRRLAQLLESGKIDKEKHDESAAGSLVIVKELTEAIEVLKNYKKGG